MMEHRERRHGGDPHDAQPAQECGESPDVDVVRRSRPKSTPASRVDERHNDEDDRHRDPSAVVLNVTSRDASRATGCPTGRSVCRKATNAVVSAGPRLLPYAGMLPSPWITWRTS